MSSVIKNLKWRYATKKFDASKKIDQENLEALFMVAMPTPPGVRVTLAPEGSKVNV